MREPITVALTHRTTGRVTRESETRYSVMRSRLAALLVVLAPLAGCERKEMVSTQPQTVAPTGTAVQLVSEISPPARPGAMAPRLTADGDEVLLTWLEPGDEDTTAMRFSRYDGRWSDPVTVTASEHLFANWADVPAVARAHDGWYLASWLQKSGEGTYEYDVRIARSNDGTTWKPMGLLHDDGTSTEHGFVSMVPWKNGIEVFWLDGRQMAATPPGPMSLRRAHVTDVVSGSSAVDTQVCDCCGTGAATTDAGPIVVYRDRDDEELRDIGIVRHSGDGWSRPQLVHADGWTIPGCPVNGPQVVAAGNRVVAAWFTGARQHHSVRVAFSDDGGASFDLPINVATYVPKGGIPLGRVDLVAVGDDVIVSWLDARDAEAVIAARRVSADGRLSRTYDVAGTGEARSSGFPQMERLGEQLVFVWTTVGEPSRLQGQLVPIQLVGNVAETAPTDPVAAGPSKNWRVPILRAETLAGESVRLRSNGKPLLVSIWATWCEPCRKELPVLAEIQKAHHDVLDVVAINVDVASEREAVERWTRLAPGLEIWVDPSLHAQTVFGATSLPANYLFDSQGRLVWHSSSVLNPDDPSFRAALTAR